MQPAELSVKVAKSCRHSNGLAIALERRFCALDGVRERCGKCAKPPLDLPDSRQVEQLFLGAFDLLPGRIVEILIESLVDNVLTKRDQLTPKIKIVDVLAVILGVYDRYCRANKLSEILRPADFCQGLVLIK